MQNVKKSEIVRFYRQHIACDKVVPPSKSTFTTSFLGSRDYPPIILKPTDTRELENICNLFSPRKAPGYDNISMRVIKHSFHLISAPLANINLSLSKGIFPDKLKIGHVQSLSRICRIKRNILSPSVWIS